MEETNIDNITACTDVVLLIHKSRDWYNVQGDFSYWERLTNKVKSAADSANTLGEFLQQALYKMQIASTGHCNDVDLLRRVEQFIESGKDREYLQVLRRETQHVVLKVRIKIKQAQEERKS